ncbi:HD domain-containing protein [Idiomarina seosinensis]|uniref:HD-GYP domain-containing protein n=1 Tax=Idiomarina seosinensis TaxID=281739 RepID=UPI003850C60F
MFKKIAFQNIKIGSIVFIKKNWLHTPYAINIIHIRTEDDLQKIQRYDGLLYLLSDKRSRVLDTNLALLKSVYDELHRSSIIDDKRLVKAVNNLVSMILSGSMIESDINEQVRNSPVIFKRSVRKMLLAASFSKHLTLNRKKATDIALAAFLIDIGLIQMPFLQEKRRLNSAERRQLQEHPTLAYEQLLNTSIPECALDVVRYHHENIDGSGYPYNLQLPDIPFGARLVRIIDTYESLTDQRGYRRAHTPEHATKMLITLAINKKLDQRLVEKFICFTRHFPSGVLVSTANTPADFRLVISNKSPDQVMTWNRQNARFESLNIKDINRVKINKYLECKNYKSS